MIWQGTWRKVPVHEGRLRLRGIVGPVLVSAEPQAAIGAELAMPVQAAEPGANEADGGILDIPLSGISGGKAPRGYRLRWPEPVGPKPSRCLEISWFPDPTRADPELTTVIRPDSPFPREE